MNPALSGSNKEALIERGLCPNTGRFCEKLAEIARERAAFRKDQNERSASGNLLKLGSPEAIKAYEQMAERHALTQQVIGGQCLRGCEQSVSE